ncbi:hypothetical protein ACFTQL_03585 [Peribacillus butanolivorans]|uniref:hypothetical protein n=1 Tax=Peribacillus butanolivorans TaxID=421767 RepID=UPI00363B1A4E
MKKRTTYKEVIQKKQCVVGSDNKAGLQINKEQWVCKSCAQYMNDLRNEVN